MNPALTRPVTLVLRRPKADELASELTCPVPHADHANQDDRPERVLRQTAE